MLKSKKFFALAVCVFMLASCGVALAEYSGGAGTEADPYIIASLNDFKELAEKSSSETTEGKYFHLTTDIDLTKETDPVSIDPFYGNFDGQGHVITVNFNSNYAVSLFGLLSKATIKNLTVTGTLKIINDSYNSNIGGIASRLLSGTIENCHFYGKIEYNKLHDSTIVNIGGIVGDISGTKQKDIVIKDSTFSGSIKNEISNVSSTWAIGGIVGSSSYASIENCKVLSGSTLSAMASAEDSNSVTTSFTAESCVGGIAGYAERGSITNCISEATLNDNATYEGGIVGYAGSDLVLSDNSWPAAYSEGINTDSGSTNSNDGDIDGTTRIVPNFDFDYYEDEYPVIVIPAGTDFSYSVTVQNPDTSKGSVYWRAWYGTESIHADKPDYFEGSGNTFTVSKTMPTNAASRYYVAVVLYYLTDTGLTDSGVRLNLYVDTDNTRKENARLHVAMVEEVPEEYKTEDLLQKLANNASVDRSDIQWLPADAIDTSEPPEPTQSMKDQVAKDSYQFAAKLNSLKVTEDGYYAFQVTVSDDLVGTKVSDLKLYYADEDEFSGSSASLAFFGLMPAINGITGSLEVSNMLGVKLDTLPKQFLATMFLSASKSITVYIVRILLLLLGGCNVGIGIAGAVVVGVVAVKFFKKRK